MIQFRPIKITLEHQDLLKGLSELPVPEIEQLIDQLNKVVEQRKANSSLEEQAASIVEKIKTEAPSAEFQERLHDLTMRSTVDTLSPTERKELQEMATTDELWAAHRLGYMMQLSEIWSISVDEVMKKLNIAPPEDIYA